MQIMDKTIAQSSGLAERLSFVHDAMSFFTVHGKVMSTSDLQLLTDHFQAQATATGMTVLLPTL